MNKPCTNCKKSHSLCFDCKKIKTYHAHLESKRKFIMGSPIKTFDELLKQEWVYAWWGKLVHIKVVKNQQFRAIIEWIENGKLFYAIRKEVNNETN